MSHAAERECAAIASRIIFPNGNCRDAVSRKTRKKHMIDLLNILPG